MAMKNQAKRIAVGMGIGMAVGGAVGLAGTAVQSHPNYQRTIKKGFNKAMKTVSNVIDAIA